MATKKASGSTALGRDSQPKHLGVKRHDGQAVLAGNILVRQRGTKFRAGRGVKRSGDDTLIALIKGKVKFATRKVRLFNGKLSSRKFVSVLPA